MQVRQTLGLRGLFLRGSKPGSLDSHAAGRSPPRVPVSQRLLRRTASAPTKSQKPGRKAFPELVLGTPSVGSEGEAPDMGPSSPGPTPEAQSQDKAGSGARGKAAAERGPPQTRLPWVSAPPGPAGMAAACMKCVVGSCGGGGSSGAEGLWRERQTNPGLEGMPGAICEQPRAQAGSPVAQQKDEGSRGPMSPLSSSLGSPEVAPCRQPGALQTEMSALFSQKLEEIRNKSPMFSTGKARPYSLAPLLHLTPALAKPTEAGE